MAELVSKRYATAFFEVAKESGKLDAYVSEFDRFMVHFGEAERVMLENCIAKADKAKIIDCMQLEDFMHSFAMLLLQKGRLDLVYEIKKEFDFLVGEERGVARALVTSATELSDEEVSALKKNLEKATGLSLEIDLEIDESIIGGLVIKMKDKVLDCSVKSRLENMLQSIREIK